jgi:3'-phosphoadenosine 5'-phosphosulfate sulfotransferase (PAPS reductase)/FAD synthetase
MFTTQERRKPNWGYLRTQKVAVSFSGGMDSTAVLLLAVRNGLKPVAVSIYGDTDHPESGRYCREICSRLSVPLIELGVAESYKYFVRVIHSNQNYLSAFRKFYRRQYHIPFRRLMGQNNFSIRLVGYRADEYQWCMGQRTFAPIFDWSKSRVRVFLKENGIPLHPCYSQKEFLKEPIRESSWIDIQNYGLFHFADKGKIIDDAVITLKWLKKYYPNLYHLVSQTFDLKQMGYEIGEVTSAAN